MEWNDVSFGMMLISLATLCLGQGYQFASQMRALNIQAQMLKAQVELELEVGRLRAAQASGLRNLGDWRELPPEGRMQLRAALAAVVAEMDADGAVRH